MKYQQRNTLSFVDNTTYNEISAEEYTQLVDNITYNEISTEEYTQLGR